MILDAHYAWDGRERESLAPLLREVAHELEAPALAALLEGEPLEQGAARAAVAELRRDSSGLSAKGRARAGVIRRRSRNHGHGARSLQSMRFSGPGLRPVAAERHARAGHRALAERERRYSPSCGEETSCLAGR